VPDDDTAEDSTSHSHGLNRAEEGDAGSGGKGRWKLTRDERKAQRGANKGRKFGKVRDELNLCWKVAAGNMCEFGSE
jgi:tRNA-dihydrouridine synthase 3